MSEPLRAFQKRFVKQALAPGIDVAALSIPRGNGKSWLAGHLLTRCLTPGDDLHVPGSEYLLCAGSIEQARLVYSFIRPELEPRGGYSFIDSTTRIGVTHRATNTRLRILSSNGKTALGIVNCPLLVADEPGSWEVVGGTAMFDAIITALGKPNSPMRTIFIGTLAPAMAGWWHDLISDGSNGSTYVQTLQAEPEKWDQWSEIRRVNPLTAISPAFRKRLRVERDAARADTRLRARFSSFRLNVPSRDSSDVVLTVADWTKMLARPVPPRDGLPIVGLDVGASRAWSAACAAWRGGRVEALAVVPGIPSLEEQEKRDRVPAGTYRSLAEAGLLHVEEGSELPLPHVLWEAVRDRWGVPASIICDRFLGKELAAAVGGVTSIEPRIPLWSNSTEDIRACRALVRDGPFSVVESSRPLLEASLRVTKVSNDTSGGTRIVKSTQNTARDDVSVAFTLVAGGYLRAETAGEPQGPSYVVVG